MSNNVICFFSREGAYQNWASKPFLKGKHFANTISRFICEIYLWFAAYLMNTEHRKLFLFTTNKLFKNRLSNTDVERGCNSSVFAFGDFSFSF